MEGKKFHIIYFESLGSRVRLRINEEYIDGFLDLMNTSPIKIIDESLYYESMPISSYDILVRSMVNKEDVVFGQLEEYVVKN